MTKLSDVVNLDALETRIEEGYIKRQFHPEHPYAILNYTDKCMFDHVWDHETMNCRGLVYHLETGEVIARGMPKFFNYNQPGAPEFALDDMVFVADKVDGSLGILYRAPDGTYGVATRGSFTSDQALHATSIYDGSFNFSAPGNNTFLFEIIYPENRIVLDYGDRDELVYLGYVDNATGRFTPTDTEPGEHFGWMTYSRVLMLPPRPNAEGLVLTRLSDGVMLKIKQEDYLALHRIIFGLSARALWQIIVDGGDVDEYIMSLPDEFQPWAQGVVDGLEDVVTFQCVEAERRFREVYNDLDRVVGEGWERGDFARWVAGREDRALMFLLLDGKDIEPVLWKQVKPAGNMTPVATRGEDVA